MPKTFKCNHCLKRHPVNPGLKEKQKYCGLKSCQQARKNQWERKKLKHDSDYRLKRQSSKAMWYANHSGHAYQRKYRLSHPDYVCVNREQQGDRNHERNESVRQLTDQIVKTDTLNSASLITPGFYALFPCKNASNEKIVKTDALIVQLTNIQSNTVYFLNKSP